jgi:hypothetical protein
MLLVILGNPLEDCMFLYDTIPIRTEFCELVSSWYVCWRNRHTLTLISDKSFFHLSGYVNSQNMMYWSAENPMLIYNVPTHQLYSCFILVSPCIFTIHCLKHQQNALHFHFYYVLINPYICFGLI